MSMATPKRNNLQQVAPKKKLFPWNNQNTINHNILLLMQYYTHKQNQHFTNILQSNFNEEQTRDSRYIPPPQVIPLCHIIIHECMPNNDIACIQNTIQSQHSVSHIYDNDGRHLITNPKQRLQWLCVSPNKALTCVLNRKSCLDLIFKLC